MIEICFEMAGIVGVDPWPYSLRQLYTMAKAKMRHEWDIGASIVCTIANSSRDTKKKPDPFMPDEINPFRCQENSLDGWALLKEVANAWKR